MTTGERIRSVMDEQNMSYMELEKRTGYSRSTLNRYCTGDSKIPLSRLPAIANALGVSQEYLLGWDVAHETYPVGQVCRMPVCASIRCGFGKEPQEELSGEYTEIISSELKGYPEKECRILRAEGESMMPYILPGDKVLIHLQDDADTGDLALVATNTDGEATLKKIRKEANLLELIPMNEDYPAITYRGKSLANVHIFGKALKVIRDL